MSPLRTLQMNLLELPIGIFSTHVDAVKDSVLISSIHQQYTEVYLLFIVSHSLNLNVNNAETVGYFPLKLHAQAGNIVFWFFLLMCLLCCRWKLYPRPQTESLPPHLHAKINNKYMKKYWHKQVCGNKHGENAKHWLRTSVDTQEKKNE